MPKRLPRNAAPIPFPSSGHSHTFLSTSPTSFTSDQYPSLGQWSDQVDIPTRSPSSYSEIEVVLDDGTLQKRTVSLSTVPEPLSPTHEDFNTHDDSADEMVSQQPTSSKKANDKSSETTPLLQGHSVGETNYNAVSESSASTTESDSDTPFFPATSKKSHKHQQHHYNPLPDKPSVWTRAKNTITHWELTTAQRQVLKCSFAYFLGSLFTFVPMLNALIGNNRVSSHLVATATVFFNPAKSLGGMVEAAAYGWGYTLSATAVCLGSMVTTDFFIDHGYDVVAHTLSLLLWLAGPTAVIAFFKAHWNKPPVATASSLCFIIIFIIVVREGSANHGDFDTTRIEQIVSAVATGTVITVSCCIIFWPYSAAKKLNKDLEATLSSYQVLLKLLTKTFLLDDDLPEFKANKTLQTAIDSHRASFTSLQKSLSDARLEVMWNRQIRGRVGEYEDIVKSMQRLAQHVAGLRSSCGIQFERMCNELQGSWKGLKKANKSKKKSRHGDLQETWSIRAGYRRRLLENEMRRQKNIEMDAAAAESTETIVPGATDMNRTHSHASSDHLNDSEVETESTALLDFIRTIRQPLKSLAYTCKQTLYHLRHDFTTPSSKKSSPSYQTLATNLEKAIALFEMSQLQAVQKTYQQRLQKRCKGGSIDTPGEDLYLVYFFVFNMIEFAREMITLVECIRRWSEAEERASKIHWWQFKLYSGKRANSKKGVSIDSFVPNDRNSRNTLHTPEPKTAWRRFFLRTWRTLSLLKQQKVRYATKCSIAATLLAAPAFMESTAEWFRTWRMEWALITLMVVMTPTVGGTNLVSIYRILSTVLGCFAGMIIYMLFPNNMYVLPVLTWLFSIPNFWMILHHKHGKFGQFTLLAYNLIVLNKYNDRDTNHVEVWLLAFQRCVAILVGVVFGLVATVYVWPYEARVELRKGLSDFLLRLARLYQKLVSVYSGRPLAESMSNSSMIQNSCHYYDPSTPQRAVAKRAFMDMELDLQRTLLDLQALLAQTPNEPRLKGAFPVDTYKSMLNSCQNVVDKFCCMRTVVFKDAWFQDVQRDFIMPVSKERREMVGNVLLYFYLLASALRLKTPLPPYFPPARNAWQCLITHLKELPANQSRMAMLDKEHVYVLYFSYVTMMEDIIRELDKLGECMTKLFGELIPTNEWDSLFLGYDIEEQQSLLSAK
ncbi:hypothetical protein K492DRAFT_211962 [Lichtheimia hyalospora FSU 10163]|nr:hypothetical protein K492DRAFT_211962 [Lichtheimia hyalospora FSU 10163]